MGENLPLVPIRKVRARARRRQEEPELSCRKVLRHGLAIAFEPLRLGRLGVMESSGARSQNISPQVPSLQPVVRRQNGRLAQQYNGDAAVAGEGGIIRVQRFGVGLAGHLVDTVWIDACRLEHAA